MVLIKFTTNVPFSLSALSQDENEMGRFLREQGSQDKSKAGKMMIAVGKAQSYSAQQRYVLMLFSLIILIGSHRKKWESLGFT